MLHLESVENGAKSEPSARTLTQLTMLTGRGLSAMPVRGCRRVLLVALPPLQLWLIQGKYFQTCKRQNLHLPKYLILL